MGWKPQQVPAVDRLAGGDPLGVGLADGATEPDDDPASGPQPVGILDRVLEGGLLGSAGPARAGGETDFLADDRCDAVARLRDADQPDLLALRVVVVGQHGDVHRRARDLFYVISNSDRRHSITAQVVRRVVAVVQHQTAGKQRIGRPRKVEGDLPLDPLRVVICVRQWISREV